MIKKASLLIKRDGLFVFLKFLGIRLITNTIGMPITLGLIVISPWIRVRLIRLFSYRIGHYALNTELLLCALDSGLYPDSKLYKTLFYTMPGEPICNSQLHRMWKRSITILPFPALWHQVDRYLMRFRGKTYRNDPYKTTFEPSSGAQDPWKYFKKIKKCHIFFNSDEEDKGRQILEKLGIAPDAPFVCLLGRDSCYLNTHLPTTDWTYHNYRNVEINTYQKAAKFLAEKGYYVIRMGKHVNEKFDMNHPMIIDYANSELRSDFMDVYLSANCFFFISPRSGIDAVAQIFRRPLLITNIPLCDIGSLFDLSLFIPKKVLDMKTNRLIKFIETCLTIDKLSMKQFFQEKGWCFVDNTSEEIQEVVEEMVERLNGSWRELSNSLLLQERFWLSIPEKQRYTFYKDFEMRVGDSFLRNHQELLN